MTRTQTRVHMQGCTAAPNEGTTEAQPPRELQSLAGMLLAPGLRGTCQNSCAQTS